MYRFTCNQSKSQTGLHVISQSHSQQQKHDRHIHVNVIRDANARFMTVKGRKMWCVIWCDRGWRIRMPVLLQIVIGERDWVGMTDMVVVMMMCVLVDRVVDGVVDRVVDCAD